MTRQTFTILDQLNAFESLGVSPIGHRATFSTPELLPIELDVRIVLALGKTIGQVEPMFREVLERYLTDLRQSVIDEWEHTYFGNIGIRNAYVDAGSPEWFPSHAAKQTHTWYTVVRPQIIGVEFLATGLIDALDFDKFTINGVNDPNGLRIKQDEENQYIPVFGKLRIVEVPHIEIGGS